MPVSLFLGILFSFCIGSIPTAYIAGKLCAGIDIRKHGSGNIGATNVFRVLGKVPGCIVLVIDVLKGVLAVVLVASLLNLTETFDYVFLAFASVCGHNWTIFLKFKGGKGVATSLGALIGLALGIPPLRLVLTLVILIWIIVFYASGYVSLASIIASVFVPFLVLVFAYSIELVLLGTFFCLFVIIRHRPNIQRLLGGREQRVQPFFRKNRL